MVKISGWEYFCYDELKSTNDEAKHFCQYPHRQIIIQAKTQTAGRGRRGRSWISENGNLFFSLVLEFDIKNIGSLVLISALSIAQTLEKLTQNKSIKLKWPNDVLLNGAKLSGILLEKGDGEYIIVGIGVNIVSSPKNNMLYKATSLSEENIHISADEFLKRFLTEFNQNLDALKNNKLSQLRRDWLNRTIGLNEKVIIRQENTTKEGIFIGIDENMALLLQQNETLSKIMVGDLFLEKDTSDDGI